MRALIAACAIAVLLAACGSSKSSTTSGGSSSTTSGSSSAAATVKTGTAGSIGTVLVDARGRTLYTFDPENGGKIVCTAACATLWPPLIVTGDPVAGDGVSGLGTIARPDGAKQVTANGHPLYTYSNDKAAGDANGDGIGGVWHAAKPSGTSGSPTPTTASSGGYNPY